MPTAQTAERQAPLQPPPPLSPVDLVSDEQLYTPLNQVASQPRVPNLAGQSASANTALDAVADWLHETLAYSKGQALDSEIVLADVLNALCLLEHAQRTFIKEMNQVLIGDIRK